MSRALDDLMIPHRHLGKQPAATVIAILLSALAAACAGPAATHETLTAGAEPLRSHFNRDVGHTRIVLIAAPT